MNCFFINFEYDFINNIKVGSNHNHDIVGYVFFRIVRLLP